MTCAEYLKVIEITNDIEINTTFETDTKYIIIGEIHVKPNVTLIIENRTLILIKNGNYPNSSINKSFLYFDTGSQLIAEDVYFVAGDENNNRSVITDNGGVWFGGSLESYKEGIWTRFSSLKSNFYAKKIFAYYLGSKDPLVKNNQNNEPSTDNDGITIMGCDIDEWNVNSLFIQESGDNGLDVVLSNIEMNELEIYYPGEDALNLQSANMIVNNKLILLVPLTDVFDRDIFDFEANNRQSYLKIKQFCYVELLGIFGDQLELVSLDLPQPTDKLYYYKDTTNNSQSYIWAGKIVPDK
jgi:hypothetical protein